MTPNAHIAAAIEILNEIDAGDAAEKTLLKWSRNNRYAGSKDRAQIRDIVFDCLRKKRSYLARFRGFENVGRALTMSYCLENGMTLDDVFTGEGFAPPPLQPDERAAAGREVNYASPAEMFDVPEWLFPLYQNALGETIAPVLEAMSARAPVDLRVNRIKTERKQAIDTLAKDYVFTEALFEDEDALRVIENPRKLNASWAYSYGQVELQDVSSQRVAKFTKAAPGERVLDYCAGGGGKTLALGAMMRNEGKLAAYDIAPKRMVELEARAKRAACHVEILNTSAPKGEFDLVLADAPCSGSGSWRRNPDAKWRFTESRLNTLMNWQDEILEKATKLVAPKGRFVYATCSFFVEENRARVDKFLANHRDYLLVEERQLTPLENGDGFYMAWLERR